MSKKWFLWRALGTLVVLGLLAGLVIGGGAMLHRASWSQGYAAGQLAAGSEEGDVIAETLPYAYRGFGYPGQRPFHPGYLGVGWIIKIGMFFLLFVVIGKIFRGMFWGRMIMSGGPWAMGAHHHYRGKGKRGSRRGWRHGPPHHRGPVPPWCWGDEEPSEEQAKEDQVEPDAATGDAEL